MSEIDNDRIDDILVGDAMDKLKELPDESVDMVVTSPPYWGLKRFTIRRMF